MQKEQRQCKIYFLAFLPCYHTSKNKTPRGPDAQSWTWNGFPQFQHPSMKAAQFVHTEPSQAGLVTPELHQVSLRVSPFPSTLWIPLSGSSQKQLCSAMQDQALGLRGHQHSKRNRGKHRSRFSGTWRQLFTPAKPKGKPMSYKNIYPISLCYTVLE